MTKKQIVSVVFAAHIFLFLSHAAVAEEERFYIEGTVFEKSSPAKSMAIINGETKKLGEKIGDYTLKEVYANGALLKHAETGAELSLIVGRDNAPPHVDEPAAQGEKKENSLLGTITEGVEGSSLNPFAAIQRARESTVRAKILRLKIGLDQHHAEHGSFPLALKDLEKDQYITSDLLGGESEYQFIYDSTGAAYNLYVEPKKPSESAAYFFVDDTSIVRMEHGKRAGKTSPVAQ